jgi:hypothetical protein
MGKDDEIAKRNRGGRILLFLRIALGLLQMIVSMAALVLLINVGVSEITIWAVTISVCLIFLRSLLFRSKPQHE